MSFIAITFTSLLLIRTNVGAVMVHVCDTATTDTAMMCSQSLGLLALLTKSIVAKSLVQTPAADTHSTPVTCLRSLYKLHQGRDYKWI